MADQNISLINSNTLIACVDKDTICQTIRHNASIAHAIESIANLALDNGEMDERQIESVIALATHIKTDLDKLSMLVHELAEQKK